MRIASTLAAAVAALVAVSPAFGASPRVDEARAHYLRGVARYGAADYDAARVEFQRAYDLAPNAVVLYNLAQVQCQLGDPAAALQSFQRYLAEGAGGAGPARRVEVAREIARLETLVARLSITTSAPGAAISVDDAPVGTTPLAAPLVLRAGAHRIVATLPGRPPVARAVDLASGDDAAVALELPSPPPAALLAPAPRLAPLAPAPAPAPATGGGAIVPIAWVVTLGLAGGTAASGVVALGAGKDLARARETMGTTPEILADAQAKAKTAAIVTDILGGAAVLAAGAAVYFTLRAGARGSTRVGIAPDGVRVGGEF